MCDQHNVRASAEDNTGQNRDKGHTPNPRTEIKIPDPVGNRTRAAGLEGRGSTNDATAMDTFMILILYILDVSTAVEQMVACAPVTQRARARSLSGQVSRMRFFRGFSSPVRQMSGSFRPTRSPNIIWPS